MPLPLLRGQPTSLGVRHGSKQVTLSARQQRLGGGFADLAGSGRRTAHWDYGNGYHPNDERGANADRAGRGSTGETSGGKSRRRRNGDTRRRRDARMRPSLPSMYPRCLSAVLTDQRVVWSDEEPPPSLANRECRGRHRVSVIRQAKPPRRLSFRIGVPCRDSRDQRAAVSVSGTRTRFRHPRGKVGITEQNATRRHG